MQHSDVRSLARQRRFSHIAFPVFAVLVFLAFRIFKGYRIAQLSSVRKEFRRLMGEAKGPVVICPNHLTMIDSVILMWALASPLYYWSNFHRLAWNIPAVENFASSRLLRIVCYLGKCLPIDRQGGTEHIDGLMEKIAHLLSIGESFMIFPEGTRSRSGRIELDEVTYGVGRILQSADDCTVLCVYMRGDKQETYSGIPASDDTFRIRMELIRPGNNNRGLRGQRDISLQIAQRLKEFEDEYFAQHSISIGGAANVFASVDR